ncbi:MAG TPA: hypothetical protein VNK49_03790 [Anaerolineales bacterium]|nr:hypothetical protein [Anaerolineales bacterium]
MRKIVTLIAALLTACIPLSAQEPLPTAYIDPSYPTLEAAPLSSAQSANGIEVRAERAWRDGKEVHVNICFTLLDQSDWSVWSASLLYAGGNVFDFATTLLSLQEPREGQPGQRCDTLSFFNIPPDADLTNVIVTIDALAAPPRAEEYCTIYMPKIQQALNERGVGIVLGCTDVAGVQTMQILSKPDTMSQEEAEQLVYSDEFYTIKGPWSFAFNLGR